MEQYLVESSYDIDKIQYLIDGFKYGFDIGYRDPEDRQDYSRNLPLSVGSPTELWNKIMKEVNAKRVAGPFKQLPFEHFVQSLVGLVPKSGSPKTRMIFHLSYNFGPMERQKSINYHTPKQQCTIKYRNLDHAIRDCLQLLKQASTQGDSSQCLIFGKTDCSNAFRIIPTLLRQHKLLCFMAKHPLTRETWYFIDKCLPFGSSKSCAIFQAFSDALRHIAQHRISIKLLIIQPAITNYLDDFLFIALLIDLCNGMMQQFLFICQDINCPISDEKTQWATCLIEFLGILMNGGTGTLSIPVDKKYKAIEMLRTAMQARKVTVKFVQSLTGTLNFLNRVIVPGRAFTRGMYGKLRLRTKDGRELKQHHHINLGNVFLQDCKMWEYFLNNTENTHLCRPFVDFSGMTGTANTLNFTSDASLVKRLGIHF